MNHYRSNIHIQMFEVNLNIFMLIPQFEYYEIFMICNIFIIEINPTNLYANIRYTCVLPEFLCLSKEINQLR